MKSGKVYLVGAGPGDMGLITIRGSECLQKADVVIYDNLCNPYLLNYAPQNSKIIFAGKHSGLQTLSQFRIERLMLRHARAGKNVVRLKGGDPFVFGRGGEEAETMQKHKIEFEVVPGVTSAIAVPAYAGIPATHRDYSSGIAIVTAYEDPNKFEAALDYQTLAKFPGTLMFLMGVKRLAGMAKQLIAFGKSPATPVAVVRWGTRGIQETLLGTLNNIAAKTESTNFRPPAVVVVGDVVKCCKQLRWFEQKPLFGKRIVVTRTRQQSSDLSAKLRTWGGEVIELPTIEIKQIKSPQVFRAVKMAAKWDWIIFTSSWGVEFFLDAVITLHGDIRALSKANFAAIGPATAAKLTERGLMVNLQSRIHTAEGLAAEIQKKHRSVPEFWKAKKILLPRSEIANNVIEKALLKFGAEIQALAIYRNQCPKLSWELEALKRIGADIVIFTSSSAAKNFWELLRNPKIFSRSLRKLMKKCRFVSIGPTTSAAMRRVGFFVSAEAKRPSVDGLLQALKHL